MEKSWTHVTCNIITHDLKRHEPPKKYGVNLVKFFHANDLNMSKFLVIITSSVPVRMFIFCSIALDCC